MDRLESVASVGKGAPDNDGHRVVKIRPAHLIFNVDGDETAFARWRTAIERELGILVVWHRFSGPAEKAAERLR
jgi:hypothetical protein